MKKSALIALLATAPLTAQVSHDRILNSEAEPQNWLTYSGNFQSHRHSLLTQIAPGNVKNLQPAWAFQALSLEKFEATPLALDGVLYTVQPPNDVVAIDGASGRVFWTYTYRPSQQARPCCGRVNRGVAMLGDSVFMATIDGHLVAIDSKSGRERWNVAVAGARTEAGYTFTVAPLVVKDKIIVGPAGGDFGVRSSGRQQREPSCFRILPALPTGTLHRTVRAQGCSMYLPGSIRRPTLPVVQPIMWKAAPFSARSPPGRNSASTVRR